MLDYEIMDTKWCGNHKDGEYLSLLDARNACDLDTYCAMFYDFESKNEKYVLCSSGGEMLSSTIFRSRLYIKNNIECKIVLIMSSRLIIVLKMY